MIKWTSSDIELVKLLMNSTSIDVFQLHQDFQLSPSQVIITVDKLRNYSVIDFDLGTLRVTRKAAFTTWLLEHKHSLFLSDRGRSWRKPPPTILREEIGNNTIHLPQGKNLSLDIKNFKERMGKGLANRGGFAS